MRTITIDGEKYTIRGLREISHKACRNLENLIPRLFFDSLSISEIMDKNMNKVTFDNKAMEQVFSLLLRDTKKFVEFLRMMQVDETMKGIMGAMLVTDMEYEQIIELPQIVVKELIEEAKLEIGGYADFTSGLGINIELNLTSMFSSVSKMT